MFSRPFFMAKSMVNMDNKNKHRKIKFLLPRKTIEEYKEIYFLENGVHLSDSEANLRALRLLRFVKFTYRPIPADKKESYANG